MRYNPYGIAVGVGILCYGVFYVIFHDVIVHQRIKWRPKNRSRYLQRMIHAHYIHHSKHAKDGCEAFGFLIVPKKYEAKHFTFHHFTMIDVQTGNSEMGFTEIVLPEDFSLESAQIVTKNAYAILSKMKNSEEEGHAH